MATRKSVPTAAQAYAANRLWSDAKVVKGWEWIRDEYRGKGGLAAELLFFQVADYDEAVIWATDITVALDA
jgi:hypothetical protein